MLHRCAVLPQLLFLALVCVGAPVSAQNPDGSDIEVAALDVNLLSPRTAAEEELGTKAATSVTSSFVVDVHNEVRSQVSASNMEYVDQDGSLTGGIRTWLNQCSYNDELVVRWNDPTFPHVNGFKAKLFSPASIAGVIGLISQMSTSNDFYKLLMKSDIRYLGCGYTQCPLLGTQYTLVACLYASRSELNLTEEPYKTGEPCTECSSGSFWCHDNLCRDDCFFSNAHCECRIDCGKYSSVASNCSCLCPSGYEGSKCQPDTTTASNEDSSSDWTQGGTTLIVSVTLILLALLCVSLCLILYHKKYRLAKSRPGPSLESRSTARRTSVYSTSSSASSFDPSKYPTPPPAYSSINITTGLDPPPYGFTASPTDAADEVVGDGGSPPPYQHQQIDV